MILYRDFAPAITKGGFLRSDHYGTFDQAVESANEWMQRERPEVVSVETVVLPNIYRAGEEGTSDAHLETAESDISSNAWHQVVRVWYRPSGSGR